MDWDGFIPGVVVGIVSVIITLFLIYQFDAKSDIQRVDLGIATLCVDSGGTLVEDGKFCILSGKKVYEVGF